MRRASRYGTRTLLPGVNDLATLRPDLAATLVDSTLANRLTLGSQKRVSWFCMGEPDAPHPRYEWDGPTAVRANGHRCAVCANRVAITGFNDLNSVLPELASQLVRYEDGFTVTAGSAKKLGWWCEGTPEHWHPWYGWHAPVKMRARGVGCPVCGGIKVIPGWNDLETLRPLVAAQMTEGNPKQLSIKSNSEQVWACESGHQRHEWRTKVAARVGAKHACPVCASSKTYDPHGQGFVYRGKFLIGGRVGHFFGKTNDPAVRLKSYLWASSGIDDAFDIKLYQVGRGVDATQIERVIIELLVTHDVQPCGKRGYRVSGIIREGFFADDAPPAFLVDFDELFDKLGGQVDLPCAIKKMLVA